MLCLKKRRTYSFGQAAAPRQQQQQQQQPSGDRSRADRAAGAGSAMVLTVTEDTPADMLAGSMELLVQMPLDSDLDQPPSQRVTVPRSTPMMDLLVQIATAHKLPAASYSLQALGERGLVLPHQPNTPVGALDALQLRLLPRQPASLQQPRQQQTARQPFEATFRLQVHLPRNQLYVARLSAKTILAEILEQVCREKNLDRGKYELRHPANLSERLDPSLTLQDYQLQEVTLYPRQQRPGTTLLLGSALSSQDIMALQKQEDCRRQQARHSVFGFIFKKSRASPQARSEEAMPPPPPPQPQPQPKQPQAAAMPSRPHRKRRPAPKPPAQPQPPPPPASSADDGDKVVIGHSRNSSDSSGYHEASVLSDNPDNGAMQPRLPETLPRRSRVQGVLEGAPRRLGQTSHASKSLGNLALASSQQQQQQQQQQQLSLSRGVSNSSLNSAGQRKKRAAPPPPTTTTTTTTTGAKSSADAGSAQVLERIVDSDESLTSDMDLSKPSSDIDLGPLAASSKASSDIACHPEPSVEPARVVDQELAATTTVARARKALRSGSTEASCRASLGSSGSSRRASGPESASFALPSLTEDEREEIALAIESIDSIVEAARARDEQPDDEVFVEEVPEAFRDSSARSCAVVSTIPKCDHLAPLDGRQFEQQGSVASGGDDDDKADKAPKKRSKVARSQSDTSHFELGPAEKHARHLTSNGEAFTFALNPKLGIGIAAASAGKTMDTDILLQRVSDTLSHSLSPPSPTPTTESSSNVDKPNFASATHSAVEATAANTAKHESSPLAETIAPRTLPDPEESTSVADERLVSSSDDADANNNSSSSGSDARHGSATSDYVSSTGEELSTADWEYQQIPAPPSAFRDDSIAEERPATHLGPAEAPLAARQPARLQAQSVDAVDAVAEAPKPKPLATQLSCEEREELKKAQVISELETKIQSNKPIAEPAVASAPKDELYASPRIAPTENNLSNFTITTYSRKKSLDIFEPMDEPARLYSETRVLSTFATLTRGKSLASEYAEMDSFYRPSTLKSAQSMERVTAITPLQDRPNFASERTEVFREKPVHRSKSYIVLSSNDKFQNRANQAGQRDQSAAKLESSTAPNNFTGTTSLTLSPKSDQDIPSHKQKFSQWRDSILERHKEPSRETQLQSLQVLKSILPQLQKSQTADNRSHTSAAEDLSTTHEAKPAHPRFDERDTSKQSSDVELRSKSPRLGQEPVKRYTYYGPPAVSLGSWSERPSLNVQIKTDTDYKLGGKNSSSGARTIVNLRGRGTDDAQAATATAGTPNDEQAPMENKDKQRDGESCVDTSSVDFRELTKAFGQSEVRLRPKALATAARCPQQRHSEYLERPKASESLFVKKNGPLESRLTATTFANFLNNTSSTAPAPPVKRYTSVVGITNNNNNNDNSNNNIGSNDAAKANFKFANGQAIKAPLKTFGTRDREDRAVPKPPTMPIITGVTLKSVNPRPKSGPTTIHGDPRDLLLESIRNFGRDKLKSVG